MKSKSLILAVLAFPALAADPSGTMLSQVRDSYPHLSPDGSRIVFQSNRTGSNQIWLMNQDGSGVTQLTNLPDAGAETPVWSPDGEHIAFAVYLAEGNNDVFVMKSNGSDHRQVTFGPGYDGHPHWSFDGERIVFNSDRDTPDHGAPWNERWHDIWSVRVDGTEVIKHTDCRSVCTYGSFSPNGKAILYRKVDIETGLDWALEVTEKNSEIYVANRDGSGARKLASHPAFDGWPLWSPDGQWVVFASNRAGPALTGQLWFVKPDGEGLHQFTAGDWGHAQPSFSAVGDQVLAYRFQEFPNWEYGGVVLLPIKK
jgi:Tol biopolymer transport system component